ncbi:ferredoxin reductase-like protein [Myriangium duriaei CBS 260.36]|uniref:Ferredoxin reductase-like protein n=1 Tax=Myriangium duriaei CBS 260.36 TaxID=1168546 RepID=A0A9P4J1R8_9PEZI|nr:ferredoxin reductase-like protein [Myriangium duriaei CBS 260.36]
MDDKFNQLPKIAWKPFGNGHRACIERGFAWLEATLAAILILQNSNVRFDDPSYKLHIKQTLTNKPKDLFMHAGLRDGLDVIDLERRFSGGKISSKPAVGGTLVAVDDAKMQAKPMCIFFGGESGTCQSLANLTATSAAIHGFKLNVRTLDEAIDNLRQNQPVLIIASSYEDPGTCAPISLCWTKTPLADGAQRYIDDASDYLATLARGDHVHVGVWPSHPSFHLPVDIACVPNVMNAVGSGIAPFHGFAQKRAAQMEGGRKLAPALLFYGCCSPDIDALYKEKLEQWTNQGIVSLLYVSSREPESSNNLSYVQDRVWQNCEELRAVFNRAPIICGSGKMCDGIKEGFMKMNTESQQAGEGDQDHEKWYAALRNERLMTDLFD